MLASSKQLSENINTVLFFPIIFNYRQILHKLFSGQIRSIICSLSPVPRARVRALFCRYGWWNRETEKCRRIIVISHESS